MLNVRKRERNGNGRTTRSKSNADLHWLEQDTKAMLTLDNTEAALKLIAEKNFLENSARKNDQRGRRKT